MAPAGWRGGLRAILPLWAGALPIGVSYALAAREAGLPPAEAVLLSLSVSSAAVQLSAVSLLRLGEAAHTVVLASALLVLHQLLFGLALGRALPMGAGRRLLAAFLLNDGPYGVVAARPSLPALLGAEVGMYVIWNAATAAGVLLGARLPALSGLGLEMVAPLLFVGLLAPQLRSRESLVAAAAAAGLAAALSAVAPASVAVLAGAAAGALLPGALGRRT